MKKINFSLFLLLCSSFILSDENIYEEILTVASKTPKKEYKVPISVDVINKNDLNNLQPLSISGILSNNLAIDTSSNGGPGQVTSIFLRGSNSNHTLVKINGIKINPATAGGASIYNLDTNLISKIEIASGPLSSIHGSEAIGGVINISTRNNTSNNSTIIGIRSGPDNHIKKYIQGNIASEKSSFSLGLLDSNTNGFPSLMNSTLDQGYENNSVISELNHNNKYLDISLSTWSSEGKVEYLIFESPVSQNYKNEAAAAELKLKFNKDDLIIFNLNSSRDLIKQNNLNFLGFIDKTETQRKSYEILFNQSLNKKFSYSAGYVLEKEDVNYSSFGTIFQKDLKAKAFFGTVELILNKNTFITSIRKSDHEIYKDQSSWNIGYLRQVNQDWLINFSSGEAYRSPNSSELFGFGSNLDLIPELSKSHEIGLSKRKENSVLKLIYFKNHTSNLINFDYVNYILKNIKKSSNTGIELRYRWTGRLVNGSLILRSQNPKDEKNKLLPRRSRKSASLNITKEFKDYVIGLNISTFDQKIDYEEIKLPGYTLINLNAKKDINEKLSFSVKIENLTNKEYFTAASLNSYYLNQDRSLWLKVNFKLR